MQTGWTESRIKRTDLPMSPARALALLELYFKTDNTNKISDLLWQLSRRSHVLDDNQLVHFMRLAERAERTELVAGAIRQIIQRQTIKPQLALAVLSKAHATESPDLTSRVEEALAERVAPASRDAFRVEAMGIRSGPLNALSLMRKLGASRRTIREATSLAQLLISAGKSRLAVRYLRLCIRRWPNSQSMSALMVAAFIKLGHPERALAWLDGKAGMLAKQEVEKMRLRLFLEMGALPDALEIMKSEVDAGKRWAGDSSLLRLLVALGRLDEADEAAEAMRRDPNRSKHKAAHFQISDVGSFLNELRIYRTAKLSDPGETSRSKMVEAFFPAASEVLDEWVKSKRPPVEIARSRDVPRRIFQYWNRRSIPPEIAEVMGSWQAVPGWRYELFDRQRAIAWLTDTYGPDYARAFKLAQHVAEECDF